jgi:hypothetical protein
MGNTGRSTMSKPLELTVYDTDPSDPDCVVINGYWEYQPHSTAKRFTDAELAAEYWALYSEYVREASNLLHCQERCMEAAGKSFQEADQKCRVLHRFATLPHFDEATL